jgi:GST-like protein
VDADVAEEPMIDIYGMFSPNVVRIYIALEELELPYASIPLDVLAGAHFKPEFMALNPNAKVPVIVDHDAPGGVPCTVFESGAILLYLAEKTGKLLPKDIVARYDVIQWMVVQITALGPMLGQYIHFKRIAPKGTEYSLDRYRTQVLRTLDVLESRLALVPYLGGAEYSIADIAAFPWIRNIGANLESVEQAYPKLMEWVATVAARPPIERALATLAEVRTKVTPLDKTTPEMFDKIFGRGAFVRA